MKEVLKKILYVLHCILILCIFFGFIGIMTGDGFLFGFTAGFIASIFYVIIWSIMNLLTYIYDEYIKTKTKKDI